MLRLLSFKSKDDGVLDEEGELEVCPMSELLQNALRNFHEAMVKKIRTVSEEEQASGEVDRCPPSQTSVSEEILKILFSRSLLKMHHGWTNWPILWCLCHQLSCRWAIKL